MWTCLHPSQLSLGPPCETHRIRFRAVEDLGQEARLHGVDVVVVCLVSLRRLNGDGEDESVAAGEAPRQAGRVRGHKLDLEDDLVVGRSGFPITRIVNLQV